VTRMSPTMKTWSSPKLAHSTQLTLATFLKRRRLRALSLKNLGLLLRSQGIDSVGRSSCFLALAPEQITHRSSLTLALIGICLAHRQQIEIVHHLQISTLL